MTKTQRPAEYYVKQAAAQRARRKANPEKYRTRSRIDERRRKLKRYGFTENSYALLLESQDGRCAICRGINTNSRDWHVDHDHRTNKIRGILCHHCNIGLGHFKDSQDLLLKAQEYLGKSYEPSSCNTRHAG